VIAGSIVLISSGDSSRRSSLPSASACRLGFGFEHRDEPIGYLEVAEIWRPCVETSIELSGRNDA
jgi:hypothetical protein